MTSRTATLIGLTAILMWSLLAVLTVATGKIPAFQLAAMTFAIGALVGCAELDRAARGAPRLAAAAAGLDRRGRRPVRLSRAVFPGAALCAAGRSGTAELSLAAVDRAVLVAVAGRAAGAAPHHRRAARPCRHGAAVCRQPRGGFAPGQVPGLDRGVRRGLRVGGLFGDVAQAQGGADRCGGGLLRGDRAARGAGACGWSRTRYGPRRRRNGWRSQRSASARSAPHSMPGISA